MEERARQKRRHQRAKKRAEFLAKSERMERARQRILIAGAPLPEELRNIPQLPPALVDTDDEEEGGYPRSTPRGFRTVY